MCLSNTCSLILKIRSGRISGWVSFGWVTLHGTESISAKDQRINVASLGGTEEYTCDTCCLLLDAVFFKGPFIWLLLILNSFYLHFGYRLHHLFLITICFFTVTSNIAVFIANAKMSHPKLCTDCSLHHVFITVTQIPHSIFYFYFLTILRHMGWVSFGWVTLHGTESISAKDQNLMWHPLVRQWSTDMTCTVSFWMRAVFWKGPLT